MTGPLLPRLVCGNEAIERRQGPILYFIPFIAGSTQAPSFDPAMAHHGAFGYPKSALRFVNTCRQESFNDF